METMAEAALALAICSPEETGKSVLSGDISRRAVWKCAVWTAVPWRLERRRHAAGALDAAAGSLCSRVLRAIQRRRLLDDDTCHGEDVWRIWELGWLDERRTSQMRARIAARAANSPAIVESKIAEALHRLAGGCMFADAEALRATVLADFGDRAGCGADVGDRLAGIRRMDAGDLGRGVRRRFGGARSRCRARIPTSEAGRRCRARGRRAASVQSCVQIALPGHGDSRITPACACAAARALRS